jgi:hypothetical protein
MYLTSTAGSFNDFTLPRTVVNKIDAINAVIGAEDFGTLIGITDYSQYEKKLKKFHDYLLLTFLLIMLQ